MRLGLPCGPLCGSAPDRQPLFTKNSHSCALATCQTAPYSLPSTPFMFQIEVYGPEASMTGICQLAINHIKAQ